MRTFTALLAFFLLAGVSSAKEADKSKALPRSIYVPIQLSVCEHMKDAVLYLSDEEGTEVQALFPLPGKHIFQFTYYPTLGRFAPDRTIIKVSTSQEDVFHYITVTVDTIYLSREKKIELPDVKKKFGYKLDVRHKVTVVRLKCKDHDLLRETDDATDTD